MIEDAAYATTYDCLPRVRLSDDRRSAMCFDADCGTVFARRVEPPEGLPQDAWPRLRARLDLSGKHLA